MKKIGGFFKFLAKGELEDGESEEEEEEDGEEEEESGQEQAASNAPGRFNRWMEKMKRKGERRAQEEEEDWAEAQPGDQDEEEEFEDLILDEAPSPQADRNLDSLDRGDEGDKREDQAAQAEMPAQPEAAQEVPLQTEPIAQAEPVPAAEAIPETAPLAEAEHAPAEAAARAGGLEEAEEAKVVEAAKEYYSSLNDTEIETMGATEEIVENLYREYAMADKVYRLIIQDINPEISDDEARKITVQQIFFATASTDMDGNLKPYSESSIQKAYEKACEVRAMAVDGEHDFTELASKYSDDSEITYSFGKGEAESAYEEAAFNLATDEVSQVIQCERGYYIIKCTNTLDREETDANKLKIVEERKREVFGQEYDSFVNTLVRQLNDKLWDEITLITDEQVTTDNFFDVYAKYFPEE